MPGSLTPANKDESLAMEILRRYGGDRGVRQAWTANYTSRSWTGSGTRFWEGRRQELSDIRDTETHADVRMWLDEAINYLKRLIEQERVDEEREWM